MTMECFYPEPPRLHPGHGAGRVVAIGAQGVVVCRREGGLSLPRLGIDPLPPATGDFLQIGHFDREPCLAFEFNDEAVTGCDIRMAMTILSPTEKLAMGRALELLFWRSKRRFCGVCGAPLADSGDECSRRCEKCGALFFPVLAPAVIVAIGRGDELLLAHNAKFKPGVYSLIAGFVEPGESLEETVRREIMEEVGIAVTNIRYFGSQSWPFPNSLMLGFRADYADGEITPDGVEIVDARFYRYDALPTIPEPGAISRTLIENFVKERRNAEGPGR